MSARIGEDLTLHKKEKGDLGIVCEFCGSVWPCWRVARAEIARLTKELEEARRDVVEAADELLIPLGPNNAPGTEGARILLANVAMRRERDNAFVALRETPRIASEFSMKPDARVHPDIPWAEMSEAAKLAAHSTAQQIAGLLHDHVVTALKGA